MLVALAVNAIGVYMHIYTYEYAMNGVFGCCGLKGGGSHNSHLLQDVVHGLCGNACNCMAAWFGKQQIGRNSLPFHFLSMMYEMIGI